MNEQNMALLKGLVKQLEANYRGYDEDGLEDDYTPEERKLNIEDTKRQIENLLPFV